MCNLLYSLDILKNYICYKYLIGYKAYQEYVIYITKLHILL